MIVDLKKTIANIVDGTPKISAGASADLAGAIWANEIEEAQLIDWLKSGPQKLRETVSWAVWDARRPQRALRVLISAGLLDASDSVRLYAVRAIVDCIPDDLERRRLLTPLLNDSCESVRARVTRALETPQKDAETN